MEKILRLFKKIIPSKVFKSLQPIYHYKMSLIGAILYGFPSRKIQVIGVTGTKGKSSVVEMINSILEEAGYKTAVAGTIRFKIGDEERKNLYKMTMPGRFFVHKLIREAVNKNCDFVILEMTSEGAKQFRHKFINLDALVFNNISPEHIESHGSYEKYLEAKLSIAEQLNYSSKNEKWIVVNGDDKEHQKFINRAGSNSRPVIFYLEDSKPHESNKSGIKFNWHGESISSPLPGVFNIYNMLAAASLAKALDINPKVIKAGLEKIKNIRGRVEKIEEGQNFEVVVDYAHTIDSLEKLYGAFPDSEKICVLGNTGGGRDKWKRRGMAEVAQKNCSHIILTNEDPYDENPREIVDQMAEAVSDKNKLEIIMDRREAINKAIKIAKEKAETKKDIAVLISGKGTDPYIMIEDGKKIPWSDESVAREELKKVMKK